MKKIDWTLWQYALLDDITGVQKALTAGANPNAQNRNRWTVFHNMALVDRVACIPVLLAVGADPTLQDQQGQTAADMAIQHHHQEWAETFQMAQQGRTLGLYRRIAYWVKRQQRQQR